MTRPSEAAKPTVATGGLGSRGLIQESHGRMLSIPPLGQVPFLGALK
jgi:hypothetical protein